LQQLLGNLLLPYENALWMKQVFSCFTQSLLRDRMLGIALSYGRLIAKDLVMRGEATRMF
jgi:hypothetical protein